MRMNRNVFALLSGVLILVPAAALACGESRYRLGHGVRFQTMQAPVPATVLLYPGTAGQENAEGLRQAGHEVTVADNRGQLLELLSANRYDVVIAPYDDLLAAEPQTGQAASPARLLPLAERGSDQEGLGRSRYGESLNPDSSLRRWLKTIHKIVQGP